MDKWEALREMIEAGRYIITMDGQVYSVMSTGTKKLGGGNAKGYQVYGVSYKGVSYWYSQHQLVFFMHHGIGSDKNHPIDHIDRDKSNNSIDNLRLVTPKINGNNIDKEKARLKGQPGVPRPWNKGANHKRPRAKLTEVQVQQIRLLLYFKLLKGYQIAELYEVHQVTVSAIKTSKTWQY